MLKCLKDINNENQKARNMAKSFNKFDKNFENKILKCSANDLKIMYLNKEVKVLDVMLIHWKQSLNFEIKVNCITEYCFNEVIEKSNIYDKELEDNKYLIVEEMPLLYGIPISAKDIERQKNYYTSVGLIAELDKRQDFDGFTTESIKKLGGVILVRSNIPQLLFLPESVNNIFGRSKNPYNNDRTVGGSSGGDCGIISYGGAKIGMSSDAAGSIRIPALFCGIYGFKPTSKRYYFFGNDKKIYDVKPKYNFVCKGPTSKHVDDLHLNFKGYINNLYDLKNYNIPSKSKFDDRLYDNFRNKKLRIGYFKDVKIFGLSEPNKNVLNETIEKLKKEGHELIHFDITNYLMELGKICIQNSFQEHKSRVKLLKGEDPVDEFKLINFSALSPNWLLYVYRFVMNCIGENRKGSLSILGRKLKNNELNKIINNYFIYYYKITKLWKKLNLDLIITPGLNIPAMIHSQSKTIAMGCIFYYTVFNYLDFPCSVIPIRKIKAGEEEYHEKHFNNDSVTKEAKRCLKNSKGLPVGIQVVGLNYQDEKVLGFSKYLEELINFDTYNFIN